MAALTSFVPSAVRNKMVWRWTTKLTGKISGWPSTLVTSLPSATPEKVPASGSDRIEQVVTSWTWARRYLAWPAGDGAVSHQVENPKAPRPGGEAIDPLKPSVSSSLTSS